MDKRKKIVLDESRFLHVNNSAKCDLRVKYPWPIVRSLSLAFSWPTFISMSRIKKIDSKIIKCGDDIKLGSRGNMMDDRVTIMSENWNNEQSYSGELYLWER